MCLELGIIPVKYVLISKHLDFLHYILSEDMSSILRKVYDTTKCDSRKGDFYQLVREDMEALDIFKTEVDIREHTKRKWKVLVSKKLKEFVFTKLINENEKLNNNKHIKFKNCSLVTIYMTTEISNYQEKKKKKKKKN